MTNEMTRQTNGTPELKYSEETFRDIYEALKELINAFQTAALLLYLNDETIEEYTKRAWQALARAEGK